MEQNRIWIALGVLLALGVATYFVYRKPRNEPDHAVHDPWTHVQRDQVTKLVIQRAGDVPAIEVEKRDGHWFINRPATGPADEQAINDALTQITEMHAVSVAAREASSHADLEVDGAHAIHVQVFRGTATAMDIFVGKNLDGGTAVRSSQGPIVYRCDHSIRFQVNREPREWRDRAITHLERAHVRSVEWHNTRGVFHFDRNNDTWSGAAANPPIERLDTARLNQTIVNMLDLHATDFAVPGTTTGISDTSPRVTIDVDNGPSVTLKLGSAANASESYLQREGSDIVYTVGRTHTSEVDLDPANIQTPPPPPDGGAAAVDATVGPPPFAGDASIPPAVMEQLRRQIMQRGGGGGMMMPPH